MPVHDPHPRSASRISRRPSATRTRRTGTRRCPRSTAMIAYLTASGRKSAQLRSARAASIMGEASAEAEEAGARRLRSCRRRRRPISTSSRPPRPGRSGSSRRRSSSFAPRSRGHSSDLFNTVQRQVGGARDGDRSERRAAAGAPRTLDHAVRTAMVKIHGSVSWIARRRCRLTGSNLILRPSAARSR
jgi:hypothetical protein